MEKTNRQKKAERKISRLLEKKRVYEHQSAVIFKMGGRRALQDLEFRLYRAKIARIEFRIELIKVRTIFIDQLWQN